ncbi:unnamed protein product [Polarella glacialis]|uniref:Uncharacterized protein n=1 Tax=Polarella glacialis TaxID=89957 RepID=A0A813LHH4_POLGL|nr:unnamed protein product [Polarella glacialis]
MDGPQRQGKGSRAAAPQFVAREGFGPSAGPPEAAALLSTIQQEVRASEERLGARLLNIEKQFEEFHQAVEKLQRLEARLEVVESRQPQCEQNLSDLSGLLNGTTDELQLLAQKVNDMDAAALESQRREEETWKQRADWMSKELQAKSPGGDGASSVEPLACRISEKVTNMQDAGKMLHDELLQTLLDGFLESQLRQGTRLNRLEAQLENITEASKTPEKRPSQAFFIGDDESEAPADVSISDIGFMECGMRTVYVGNLPDDIRPRDVEYLFEEFGLMNNIDIKQGINGTSFAFLNFERACDAADAAHRRNGYDFEGELLRVELKDGKGRSKGNNKVFVKDDLEDERAFLLVSGFPKGTRWQQLKDHMRQVGEVGYCEIEDDGAQVRYLEPNDARTAVATLDGSSYTDRFLGKRAVLRVRFLHEVPPTERREDQHNCTRVLEGSGGFCREGGPIGSMANQQPAAAAGRASTNASSGAKAFQRSGQRCRMLSVKTVRVQVLPKREIRSGFATVPCLGQAKRRCDLYTEGSNMLVALVNHIFNVWRAICNFDDFVPLLGIDEVECKDRTGLVMVAAEHMFAAALPPHWSEQIDESSSRVYFFNAESSESLWMHPQEALFKDLIEEFRTWRQNDSMEAIFARSDSHLRRSQRSAVEAMQQWSAYDAPQGPEEAPEVSLGESAATRGGAAQFYFNAATGESSWSDPRESVEFDLRMRHTILGECIESHSKTLPLFSPSDSSEGENEPRQPPQRPDSFMQNLWESLGTLPLPLRQAGPSENGPPSGRRPAQLPAGDDTVRSSMSYLTARSNASCAEEARQEAPANHPFVLSPER